MSVTFLTSVGEIKLELFCEKCPKTCYNFLALCASDYYLNTQFHKNIKGFLVQGGDPTGSGTGGESIFGGDFKDEFDPDLKHSTRGILAMANRGENLNGSQFYIIYSKQPHLDGKNTVFGRVIDGMDALEALERIPVDQDYRPLQAISIKEITIHANPIADADV